MPAVIECLEGKSSAKRFWIELPLVKIGSSIQECDFVIDGDREVAHEAVLVEYVDEQMRYYIRNDKNNGIVRVGQVEVHPGKRREWSSGAELRLSHSTVLRLTVSGSPAPCPNPSAHRSGSENAIVTDDSQNQHWRKVLVRVLLGIAIVAVMVVIACDPFQSKPTIAPPSDFDQLLTDVIELGDGRARMAVIRLKYARGLQQRGQAIKAKREYQRAYDQFRSRLRDPDIGSSDRKRLEDACVSLSKRLLQSAPLFPEWRT